MQALRRTAQTAARKGRPTLPRQQRRYAHDEHHHHQEPVNEPMGMGFWGTIAAIPIGAGLYAISRSDDPDAPPVLTRLINRYTEKQDELAALNDLHVRMIEQAADDRMLFKYSAPQQERVDMRFPEIMNQGSPFNVPAGHMANMDKVIEKYRKEAYEDNERKLQALRDNNIKGEQPFERFSDPAGPGPSNRRWPSKGAGSV